MHLCARPFNLSTDLSIYLSCMNTHTLTYTQLHTHTCRRIDNLLFLIIWIIVCLYLRIYVSFSFAFFSSFLPFFYLFLSSFLPLSHSFFLSFFLSFFSNLLLFSCFFLSQSFSLSPPFFSRTLITFSFFSRLLRLSSSQLIFTLIVAQPLKRILVCFFSFFLSFFPACACSRSFSFNLLYICYVYTYSRGIPKKKKKKRDSLWSE